MTFLRHHVVGLVCLVMGLLVVWQLSPALAGPAPSQVKPALYDFGRGMCLPCKEMEKVLTSVKSEYGDQVEVRLVMLENDEALFKQYKIMMVPTQVFLDAAGKEVDRNIGALTKEQVLQKLKKLKFIK